jgi:hypothetical protein
MNVSTVSILFAATAAFSPAMAFGEPPEPTVTEAVDAEPSNSELLDELARIQDRLDELELTLNTVLDSVVLELAAENERLRGLLRDQYAAGVPRVPMPDRDLLKNVIENHIQDNGLTTLPAVVAGPTPHEEVQATPAEHEAPLPDVGDVPATIVKEWGRTAEEAARLNVASLKGMILAVPETSSDEELIALGMQLRDHYADYENVNIEAFDSLTAARKYAQDGIANPERRVLHVSRFAGTGRDAVFLIRGDSVREIE